ncbi:MAG: DUF2764 family protein [Candidatus Algichlamydia australiensis]|nr:DUF2764 family protein [Chlamydiales bacterium]
MKNYYFVAASLPSLALDQELEISFASLMELFAMNLGREDLEQITLLRSYFDIENLFHLLRDETLNLKGNLFRGELEEAILHPETLPNFLQEFFIRYPKEEQQLKNSHIAYELYFHFAQEEAKGFLKRYLQFERKRRLSLAAYRAKKQGRDWAQELIDEERFDSFTASLLAQKEGKGIEFSFDLRDLGEKLLSVSKPYEEAHMMAEYRLNKIDDLSEFPLFSFDYLVAYTIKLIILEEMANYDQELGREKWNVVSG